MDGIKRRENEIKRRKKHNENGRIIIIREV